MKKKSLDLDVGSLLAGMALGAGFVIYRNMRERKDPENAPGQRRINNALSNALRKARKKEKIKPNLYEPNRTPTNTISISNP